MATAQHAGAALHQVRELIAAQQAGGLPDPELLARFTATHDEGAFAALVRRHGPLVLGVCRRVLGNAADADDAFQSTFLILARKAHAIARQASLSCWLYRVAYRTALKARTLGARRKAQEASAPPRGVADALAEVTGRELLAVLDEELQGLAERYRAPLVLCYLEGKTRDEAARQLRCSLGTLKRRLEQARHSLARRLTKRGLTFPAALLTAGLAQALGVAAVPARLTTATLRCLAAPPEPVATSAAAALADGMFRTAAPTRLAVVAAVLIACAALAMSFATGTAAARSEQKPKTTPQAETKMSPRPAPSATLTPARGDAAKVLEIAGRVFDRAGKIGIVAKVILVGTIRPEDPREPTRSEVLAHGQTDRDGNYRLRVQGTERERYETLAVLAGAKGNGLACQPVERVDGPIPTNLFLRPEQPVTVALIDLQGLPAAGVKVRVHGLGEESDDETVRLWAKYAFRNREAHNRNMYLVRRRMLWGLSFVPYQPLNGVAFWPPAHLTTDARGRLTLRGFGQQHTLRLLVEDDRFAPQELRLKTGAGAGPTTVTLSLTPAHWLEGQVVGADSGLPLAGATLVARTSLDRKLSLEDVLDLQVSLMAGPRPLNRTAGRTDAQGRFRVSLAPGDTTDLSVFAPDGAPYLSVRKTVKLARGRAKHTLRQPLPRGIEVRGRVTEQATGAAIGRAKLYFLPLRENNPGRNHHLLVGEGYPTLSGPDGGYRIVVPPQPGHLLFARAGQGFIERPIPWGELCTGKPAADRRFDGRWGGERVYFHAFHALSLKVQPGPVDLPVCVRRGVTLRGRLVGPRGEVVPRAVLFCGGELLEAQPNALRTSALDGDLGRAIPLVGGGFELRGCDPDQTYRLYFLSDPRKDATDPRAAFVNEPFHSRLPLLGAAVRLAPQPAPVTVRLQPCGAAEIRFLDARGRRLSQVLDASGRPVYMDENGKTFNQKPYLGLRVEPRRGKFAAERMFLAFPFGASGYRSPFSPDQEGRVRLTGLIPGATYRLQFVDEDSIDGQGYPRTWGREFTVEPGQTRRLPDLVLPLSF